MMSRRRFLMMLVPTTIIAFSACAAPGVQLAPAPRLKAIATFSIIGEMVQNVAGDKVGLTTLVGPDADVHDFEPAPSDSVSLADAQLIFENGLALESWLDNLYQSSGSRAVRVAVSEGIQPRERAPEGAQITGRDHGEFDPHVWQNPQNAIQMVRNISAALAMADPDNAATYIANADTYIANLEALDNEIVALVEQVPAAQRKIVTSHDALGYFAGQYGFTIIGSVIPALSTEAGDPSAQDIAKLVREIEAEGVKAVFLESVANPKLVERVAQEAGVKIGPKLYTDALGAPSSEGGSYIDAIRFNANALVDLLK